MAWPLLSARTRGRPPSAALTPAAAFAPVFLDLFFSDKVLSEADSSAGVDVCPARGAADAAPYSAAVVAFSGRLSTKSPTARACFRAGCFDSVAGGSAGPLSELKYAVSTAACSWVLGCLRLPVAMTGSLSVEIRTSGRSTPRDKGK